MPIETTDEKVLYLVNEFHFKQGKSLRMIEREHGLSNDTLRKRCIKLGVKTKSRIESMHDNEKHVVRPSGDSHWMAKDKDALASFSEASSKRMKLRNPSRIPEVRDRIVSTLSEKFKLEPTFHEGLIIDLLREFNCDFDFQVKIGSCIVDFVIGKCAIELDGRGHASRKASDRIRDQHICGAGWNVVRINQDCIFNKRLAGNNFRPNKLMRVIEQFNPWLDISSHLPPIDCDHRVLVREAYTCAEIVF